MHCFPTGCARTSHYSSTPTRICGSHTREKTRKNDTHKDFRVRRHRVEETLRWLKDNNPAYGDVIDGARIENLPEDGELPNLRTVEFSETERIDVQGPASQQLDAGDTDSTDDSTVSGIVLPEPGVNVQAQVDAAINEVVSEPQEGEAGEAQRNVQ